MTLRQARGDKWDIAEALNLLGEVMQRHGELDQANALYIECLLLDRAVGDKARMALTLRHLATIAQYKRQDERAVRLFAAAATMQNMAGGTTFLTLTDPTDFERSIMAVRATVGEEAFAAEWAQGQALPLEITIEYALAWSAQGADSSSSAVPTIASSPLLPSPAPAGLSSTRGRGAATVGTGADLCPNRRQTGHHPPHSQRPSDCNLQ